MWIIPTETRFALKGSAAEIRYEKPDSVEQGMPALSNQMCFSEVQAKTIKWTHEVSREPLDEARVAAEQPGWQPMLMQESARRILGGALEVCSCEPMTGWFRDGH